MDQAVAEARRCLQCKNPTCQEGCPVQIDIRDFIGADVVRNLALRDAEKGLSTGEKQMFGKVKRMLASELMYAKSICLEDATSFLDGVLAEICANDHSHCQ